MPGADEPVVLAAQRPVVGVRDHGVEVAEEQEPLGARARQADEQVGRVVGGGARDALDLRLVRRERRRDRRGLVGAVDVAARRGDGDERLELARRAGRDGAGVLLDPVVHVRVSYRPWRRAPASTIATTSSGSSVQRMRSMSSGATIPSPTSRSRIQANSPSQ